MEIDLIAPTLAEAMKSPKAKPDELWAIFMIAQRDIIKFLRDRGRLVSTLVFPFVFIGLVGGTLQAGFGGKGVNFLLFTFSGVIGQTIFASSAQGIISLVEDRENDFSQEIFIAPVSRYSIIVGKILGEGLVSMTQAVGIVIFGFIIGIRIPFENLLLLIPAALVICLAGGAFGLLVLCFMSSQRAAQQVFPFLIFPQFFLAGVFAPIKGLDHNLLLNVLSHLAPMRYSVDLGRDVIYFHQPDPIGAVLDPTLLNLVVIAATSLIFMVVGTTIFVRNEKNR